jgi:hypothetical protein
LNGRPAARRSHYSAAHGCKLNGRAAARRAQYPAAWRQIERRQLSPAPVAMVGRTASQLNSVTLRAARNSRLHGVELNSRTAARRAQYPGVHGCKFNDPGGGALPIFGCTASN